MTVVTSQTRAALERFASKNIVTKEFRKTFFEQIQKSLGSANPALNQLVTEFMNDARQNLEYSIAFQRIVEGHLDYGTMKSIVTRNLLEWFDSTNRAGSYLKYVAFLIEHQKIMKQFGEAGFATLLYIDKLEWSKDLMPAYGDFPQETCSARKERLMKSAISDMDKGTVI